MSIVEHGWSNVLLPPKGEACHKIGPKGDGREKLVKSRTGHRR